MVVIFTTNSLFVRTFVETLTYLVYTMYINEHFNYKLKILEWAQTPITRIKYFHVSRVVTNSVSEISSPTT